MVPRAFAVVLVLAAAACAGPTPDPLAVSKACAPAGWTAGGFPPGSRDYGLGPGNDVGRIRLLTPESVASGKGVSKPGGATFITDWWTVTPHDETKVTFADGRTGTRYTSTSGQRQVTTEFATPAGTWQLWTRSDEHYDEVLRCVEGRLAGTASPASDAAPATIEIEPRTVALEPGQERQFTATVRDRGGRALSVPVQWDTASDDIVISRAIGTITAAGKLTAIDARGARGRVIARAAGLEATASVVIGLVGPRSVEIVTVSQALPQVRPGASITLVGVARDPQGQVLCWPFSWSVDPPAAGTISFLTKTSDEIVTFAASPTFKGDATVRIATTLGPRGTPSVDGTISIDVGPTRELPSPSLDPRRYISPQAETLAVGRQVRFGVGPSATWAVCPRSIGTIAADGTFTAAAPGEGVVVSTVQGLTGIALVTVR